MPTTVAVPMFSMSESTDVWASKAGAAPPTDIVKRTTRASSNASRASFIRPLSEHLGVGSHRLWVRSRGEVACRILTAYQRHLEAKGWVFGARCNELALSCV